MVDEAEMQQPEPGGQAERKRERSRVEFPYADLQMAVDLATMIFSKGGGSCEESQLAVWLDQSVTGGTFRSRLSAAKMFGLIEGGNKALTLTSLGRKTCDGRTLADAKAEAFLHIPLYAELYGKWNGNALPPAAAIERQMTLLGVVETQSDRARQTFVKSAAQAGYMDTCRWCSAPG